MRAELLPSPLLLLLLLAHPVYSISSPHPLRRAGNVITSVAAADKLVAASVGQKKTGRRLTATDEELGLVDGQTWYWCRDSKTKAWKKCDVASAIAGSTSSNTGNGGGGGGGSGGAGGGSDDVAAQKAARQAAAREREESSRGPKVSAATNSNNWMYSNTGGYYRHVPRPLLNAFVVSCGGRFVAGGWGMCRQRRQLGLSALLCWPAMLPLVRELVCLLRPQTQRTSHRACRNTIMVGALAGETEGEGVQPARSAAA